MGGSFKSQGIKCKSEKGTQKLFPYGYADLLSTLEKFRTSVQLDDHAVELKLMDLQEADIIEKVEGPTPWLSPVCAVPKQSGDIRLCVDMRRANETVLREWHPTPTVDEVLHNMNQSTVFSKLDLKWGFHQIEWAEESRGITTFTTHAGLFHYKRLMFGISSAPELYQHIIQQVLQGCEGAHNIADNIIVHGRGGEEHKRLDSLS